MTISVTYVELKGSGKLSIGEDGEPVGERLFEVDWDDSVQMLQDLRGTQSGVIRTEPDAFPWLSGLYCVDASRQGSGKTGMGAVDQIAYTKARVRAVYKLVQFDPSGVRVLIDETLEPRDEFLTFPPAGLYWDNAQAEPIMPEEAPGRLVRMLDWVYTIHEVENLPTELIDNLSHVNSEPVTSSQLGLTFAAETLLIGTEPLRRQITTEGATAWEVTWRFTYNPLGWNKYLRSGYDTPQTMYDGSGVEFKQYPTVAFGSIVR